MRLAILALALSAFATAQEPHEAQRPRDRAPGVGRQCPGVHGPVPKDLKSEGEIRRALDGKLQAIARAPAPAMARFPPTLQRIREHLALAQSLLCPGYDSPSSSVKLFGLVAVTCSDAQMLAMAVNHLTPKELLSLEAYELAHAEYRREIDDALAELAGYRPTPEQAERADADLRRAARDVRAALDASLPGEPGLAREMQISTRVAPLSGNAQGYYARHFFLTEPPECKPSYLFVPDESTFLAQYLQQIASTRAMTGFDERWTGVSARTPEKPSSVVPPLGSGESLALFTALGCASPARLVAGWNGGFPRGGALAATGDEALLIPFGTLMKGVSLATLAMDGVGNAIGAGASILSGNLPPEYRWLAVPLAIAGSYGAGRLLQAGVARGNAGISSALARDTEAVLAKYLPAEEARRISSDPKLLRALHEAHEIPFISGESAGYDAALARKISDAREALVAAGADAAVAKRLAHDLVTEGVLGPGLDGRWTAQLAADRLNQSLADEGRHTVQLGGRTVTVDAHVGRHVPRRLGDGEELARRFATPDHPVNTAFSSPKGAGNALAQALNENAEAIAATPVGSFFEIFESRAFTLPNPQRGYLAEFGIRNVQPIAIRSVTLKLLKTGPGPRDFTLVHFCPRP